MKHYIVFLLLFCFPITAAAQNDCPEALYVCGDNRYWGLNATGIGNQQELGPNACGSSENNSIWLKVLVKDGGTLGFIITPGSGNLIVDYDFWLFGPVEDCDVGTAIRCSTTNPLQAFLTYNTTGMTEEAQDVSEGPGPNGNAWVNWITADDYDVYYLVIDRPVGVSDFSIEWTGTATFHPSPEFLNPDNITLDITQCDNDGVDDNSVAFNLTVHEDMFIGDQDDVVITYHTSSNDAIIGINPMLNPESYGNTSSTQTIYLRMENQVTGCYTVETFDIIIPPTIAGTPDNMMLCDTQMNGIRQFDLSVNEDLIKNGITESVVTYHLSMGDAGSGTSPIGPLFSNTIPYGPQTVWARLERTGECEGHDVKSFTLTVPPLPLFNNPSNAVLNLQQCDNDGIDDQSDVFDLTAHEAMFISNQQNVSITYHLSAEDAISGEGAIATPTAYANSTNPQTIFARMHNSVTGCIATLSFNIEIVNLLSAGVPQDLELCDINNNGINQFDLSQNNAAISNGEANTAVTYYLSQQDAENEVNSIGPLYQNVLPYTPETIWARLENTSGCFGKDITSFTINVTPLPVFNNPQSVALNLEKCDDDAIDDQSAAFNLTVHELMFTGTQSNITYSYHLNPDDANNGSNAISNPAGYANTSNPQVIYVRMLSTVTECYVVTNFEIEVVPDISAGEPVNLKLCDTALNGLQQFDLTQNNALIQNGNPDTAVVYYASQEDAQNETNPLPEAYTNTTPYSTQTIWARLESTEGCWGHIIKSFTISVLPLPAFNNPQNMVLDIGQCDNDDVDDQSSTFNLTVHNAMLIGTQSNLAVSFYTDSADAAAGINRIINPETFVNTTNPQTVYIRFDDTATGCSNILDFDLDVINPVMAGEPQDIAICDTYGHGHQWFNLSLNDELIRDGSNNTSVTYYASEEDAENEVNEIYPIHMNPMPYQWQQIWARLENLSGCFGYAITSFSIDVLPMPEIEYSIAIDDFSEYNNAIAINVQNSPEDYEYSIDGINYSEHHVFTNLEPGLYTVYIRSKNGCKEVQDEVVLLNYPKFFTPNGDGVNEQWTIPYLSLVPVAQVYIFDRYGKLITGYPGMHSGWDGTYNGNPLPATDYWFVLELENGRTIKGHFAMIR